MSYSRYIHEPREVSHCIYSIAQASVVAAIIGAVSKDKIFTISPCPIFPGGTEWRLQIQTSSLFLLFTLLFNLAEYRFYILP